MSFDFQRAQRVARAWFEASNENGAITLAEGIVATRPYGWVFFGKHVMDLAVTGMPALLVDRVNGEVLVLGSGTPLEVALARYEATIPPARLSMTPQLPPSAENAFDTGMTTLRADQPVCPDDFPPALRVFWNAVRSER